MKITIIAVGKIKEKYLKDAIAEYSKRLGKYTKLNIIEVNDEKTPDNISSAEMLLIKKSEGDKILKYINDDGFIIALVIEGTMLSSENFSELLETQKTKGNSHFYFIIGGSLGLSKEVIDKSHYKLSFSNMTFPHQLMRLILLEQIYRGFRIAFGEPYHK